MSASPESTTNTFFDLSNPESRRREFRRLLILFMVANFAGPILSEFIAPAPAVVQEASTSVIESIPEWQYYTGLAAAWALLAVGLFGVYRLWNFKWHGVEYLALSVFFPYFLILPVPFVQSAFGAYVDMLGSMVAGVLLCVCCGSRDMFDPAPVVNPSTADKGHSPPSPTAS